MHTGYEASQEYIRCDLDLVNLTFMFAALLAYPVCTTRSPCFQVKANGEELYSPSLLSLMYIYYTLVFLCVGYSDDNSKEAAEHKGYIRGKSGQN